MASTRGARALLKRALPDASRAWLRALASRTRASTSQAGQDAWVFGEAFDGKRGGFFLDVGAADGVSLSNTFLLEKRYRWRGICVEANPETFERLTRARRAHCVNACLDTREGTVDFVLREQLSGIVAGDADNTAPGAVDRVVQLPSRRLDDVLRECRAPRIIDYLSLDVEGAESRVLGGLDFDAYTFRTLTIERPKDALRETLAAHGYEALRELPGLDTFYVHASFRDEYVRNAFAFWERYRGSARAFV